MASSSSSVSSVSASASASSAASTAVPFELPAPTFVGPSAEEVSQGIDLSGKTVVITGANAGLGKESARVFLLRGAFVVLGVRKQAEGEQAVADIAQSGVANAAKNSVVLQLDLADDKSIVRFASDFASLNRPIHVLLLNAGIMSKKLELVGWNQSESQFAVNHLGHFLLTHLLLNAVVAGNARVVVVSSLAHSWSSLFFDDINFTTGYDKLKAYGQSKTANILFAKELNRRFVAAGVKARANSLHPGVIATKMANHSMDRDEWAALLASGNLVFRTLGQGAATSLWAAVAPELEGLGGLYLEDARISQVSSAIAGDADAAARLWKLSEDLVRPAVPNFNANAIALQL